MARILIAEDERDIRELITLTLNFSGHEVFAAANGVEAVEMAKQILPDLIFMDVRMPIMSGYDACKAIKAETVLANIPIVFLSAKGQESDLQTGIGLGAVDYILKPFSPEQLIECVKAILSQ